MQRVNIPATCQEDDDSACRMLVVLLPRLLPVDRATGKSVFTVVFVGVRTGFHIVGNRIGDLTQLTHKIRTGRSRTVFFLNAIIKFATQDLHILGKGN